MEQASPNTAFATGHPRVVPWPGLLKQNDMEINFCKNSTVLDEAEKTFHACRRRNSPKKLFGISPGRNGRILGIGFYLTNFNGYLVGPVGNVRVIMAL